MLVRSSGALTISATLTTTQVMNGLTCVQRIREWEQQDIVHGHVPVIAVTANVRAEQVKIAMKAEMDSVISKPFRVVELVSCKQKTLTALANL